MSAEPPPEQLQTEQEALASNARIKRALRWSSAFYTPLVALLLWAVDAPYWLALTAVFVLIELVAYPVLVNSLDRSTEKQIAEIRERDGLSS